MKLVGANAGATVTGADEMPGRSNYFIGNDPKQWRTNVPNYAQVKYSGVYPGVDLVYYGNQGGQLEYDFVVAPGADPSVIRLDVGAVGEPPRQKRAQRGAPLQIAENGDLVVRTGASEVRFRKPVVYQEQSTVQEEKRNSKFETENSGTHQSPLVNRHFLGGRYVLDARNNVRFKVAPYDHSKPLFIDPTLSYSTYLGGSGGDEANGIAVDSQGYAYVAGFTTSTNFPVLNAYQPNNGDVTNAFVTKLNATGSALVYSTYLGGSDGDEAYAIAVDSSGDAYVTGRTSSTNFPTQSPLQGQTSNSTDGKAFVAELNAAGSALVYSTYLGGSGGDSGQAIAVDSSGNAYVTGRTDSADFPLAHAYISACSGCGTYNYTGTGFVSELNFTASELSLVYSTYWGGTGGDGGTGIAVDSFGDAYITGFTDSGDFPITNEIQSGNGGEGDAFVSELNFNGTVLTPVYSTYLGGSGFDEGEGIAIDSSGNTYVTGYTDSTNFPIVYPVQAFGGNYDAFVAKLNFNPGPPSPLLTLVYSTYLGGSGGDYGQAIAADSSGNAYVTGFTGSTNFPLANPFPPGACTNCGSPNFAYHVFVTELNSAGSNLTYSTLLGGSTFDQGKGIAVDSSGDAYVTGYTESSDFLLTANSFQGTLLGTYNAFVAEISSAAAPSVSFSPPTGLAFGPQAIGTTSAIQTITVTNVGSASLNFGTVAPIGTNAPDFTKAADSCSGQTVPPAGTCSVSFNFIPSIGGSESAVLNFPDNASNSPQTVSLFGAGILLESIVVAPANPSLPMGGTQQFTAVGTFSDGSTQNLTNPAAWSSSAMGVATISSAGLATAIAAGPTTISASFTLPSGTPISGSTTLTVTTGSAFSYTTGGSTGGLNTPRYAHTATLLNNGLVLIAGGLDVNGNLLASAELYNPATGTFTYTTNLSTGSQSMLNTAREHHSAALLDNGMVLLAGGYGPGANPGTTVFLTSAELYDPSTGTFSYTTNLSTGSQSMLNTARAYQTATVLNSGMVLLAGGFGNDNYIASAELYNPSTGIFSYTAGPLNTARYHDTATMLNNGMVLITGGVGSSGDLASAELYNPSTGTFTDTGSLNLARSYHTATLLNGGMVLVAGGNISFSPFMTPTAELYNPATGTFAYTTGNLNTARSFYTATLLNNGMVLAAGGFNDSSDDLASAELYNPTSGTFTTTGSLNTARDNHTATLLNNGVVLIAGGTNTSGTLGNAELYQPATLTPPNLDSISLTPASATVALDTAQLFTATGTFSNGSMEQLASVTWSSFNTAVAGITDDVSNSGAAYTQSGGSTTVSACAGNVCGLTTLTVSSPVAGFAPPTLTFVSQNPGTTSAPLPVIVGNTGNATLIFTSIVPSANFGVTPGADNCVDTLAAGSSCTIYVTFTPTGTSPVSGTLTITDNSSGANPQIVNLSGTGVGNTATGSNVMVSTPVSSEGDVSVTFSNVTAAGNTTVTASTACASGPPNFSVGSAGGAGECVDISTTATWSGTATITLSFNTANYAPCPPGPMIFHDASGSGWQNVTVAGSVNCTSPTGTIMGSVTNPPGFSPFGLFVGLPAVSLPESSENFGPVLVDLPSSAQQVILTNSGAANLNISSAELSGANAGDFTKTSDTCSGATVSPGNTCTVGVTFTPSAMGDFSASLIFTDNSGGLTGSTQTVTLTGTGIVIDVHWPGPIVPPLPPTRPIPLRPTPVPIAQPPGTSGGTGTGPIVPSPGPIVTPPAPVLPSPGQVAPPPAVPPAGNMGETGKKDAVRSPDLNILPLWPPGHLFILQLPY